MILVLGVGQESRPGAGCGSLLALSCEPPHDDKVGIQVAGARTPYDTTTNRLTSIVNHLITGDINAHSHQWHSPTEDHRGSLIADIIANPNQITLNTNTSTLIPPHANQQPTSPDITTITNTLQRNTDWATMQALSSGHLPILITYKSKTNYKIQQHRRTYTNYKKANWQEFTQEIEQTLANTETPQNAHTANKNTNQRHTRRRQTSCTERENTPHTQTTARTHKKHDKIGQHKHRQRNTKPQTST